MPLLISSFSERKLLFKSVWPLFVSRAEHFFGGNKNSPRSFLGPAITHSAEDYTESVKKDPPLHTKIVFAYSRR